jgi:hypothetical protein
MTDFNASQAAKRIGISDRTIRRWLKPDKHGKVKLPSIRTESGQLAIAAADVERLRQEVEEERTRFVATTHTYATTRPEMPTHDIDLESRLASMAQSIANLNAAIDIQSRRINELTKRAAELESKTLESGQAVPTQTQVPLHRYIVDREEAAKTKPLRASTASDSTIPNDWTLCSNFFETHDIKETTYRRWLKDGIAGEYFEFEEVPRPGRTDKYRYFTPTQQEHAIFLLRKHGKLS